MKTPAAIALLCVVPLVCRGKDPSDAEMPAIVAKAKASARVEVRMAYIQTVGECFPDPDAQVRFLGGRVIWRISNSTRIASPGYRRDLWHSD